MKSVSLLCLAVPAPVAMHRLESSGSKLLVTRCQEPVKRTEQRNDGEAALIKYECRGSEPIRPCSGFKIANQIAVQQAALLHSKRICCTATAIAIQEMDFLRSKSICWTATGLARQQVKLLGSNSICYAASRFAAQQMDLLCCN